MSEESENPETVLSLDGPAVFSALRLCYHAIVSTRFPWIWLPAGSTVYVVDVLPFLTSIFPITIDTRIRE